MPSCELPARRIVTSEIEEGWELLPLLASETVVSLIENVE
jgi:hypothetical protein